jgi:hypothetical protein
MRGIASEFHVISGFHRRINEQTPPEFDRRSPHLRPSLDYLSGSDTPTQRGGVQYARIAAESGFVARASGALSTFEQFVWDLEHRGIADIDIPVLILGVTTPEAIAV